ncbi:hypothetical protein [Streptomyces sp. NPDC001980]|uniref:hypothetical protein n=1 Tax=Streptomyces sp. NPDC001980 TaxID=3157126 RepID=UPI0033309D93
MIGRFLSEDNPGNDSAEALDVAGDCYDLVDLPVIAVAVLTDLLPPGDATDDTALLIVRL